MQTSGNRKMAHPTQYAGRPIEAARFRLDVSKPHRHLTSVERLEFVVTHNWTYNSVLEARYLVWKGNLVTND